MSICNLRVAGVMCGVLMSFSASAQKYPNQPLRMLVGYPPGGGSDVVARLVAQALAQGLGQQIVVDNRPGAATMIASSLASKANPDGYTVLFATSSFVINPSLYRKVPYDPIKDFAPVSLVGSTPFVLVVHPAVPATSVKDLIALAKSRPGQLNYSSGGTGSTGHLATELFRSMAGLELQHIPYKGLGPALTDLLAGRVTFTFASLPSVIQHIKAGKLTALGLTSEERTKTFPDVPTIAESGLPGYEVDQWFGLVVPTGTTTAIVGRLNKEIARIADSSDMKERFAGIGADALYTSPETFGSYMKSEYRKWAKVIAISGARAE